MTTTAETRSVIIERDLSWPVQKVWRALTQPHLLADWLMQNDFQLRAGHRFQFRGEWGSVDCQVLVVEPDRTLSYTWAAMGLETVVTWTLTPVATGTRLRMEQVGFRPDQEQAYQGAQYGWQQLLARLEQVLARPDADAV
jgi:uncharacterized protein YndB with AHSA1/START domain